MSDAKPDFPENPTLENLQQYYKAAVDSRFISSSHDDQPDILLNIQLQVALLSREASRIPRAERHREVNTEGAYGALVAEVLWEIIRLANSRYGTLDLTAALKAQELKHDEQEAERAAEATKQKQAWYDAQPKYHAEGSGMNPLRADGLYGKAAAAADGDWYSSH